MPQAIPNAELRLNTSFQQLKMKMRRMTEEKSRLAEMSRVDGNCARTLGDAQGGFADQSLSCRQNTTVA